MTDLGVRERGWYVHVAVDKNEAADVELAALVEQRVLDVLLDHKLRTVEGFSDQPTLKATSTLEVTQGHI